MKRFYYPNTLLLIAALPLTLIPTASGAAVEINKDGDARLITDDGQPLDLRRLTTLPWKLISLASQTGLEITSSAISFSLLLFTLFSRSGFRYTGPDEALRLVCRDFLCLRDRSLPASRRSFA